MSENINQPNQNPIDEKLARAAHHSIFLDSYETGSATKKYLKKVENITQLAEIRKSELNDPVLSEKIDALVTRYAETLANYINERNKRYIRNPSYFVTGAGGRNEATFNKYQQQDFKYVDEQKFKLANLARRIETIGSGGIKSSDPRVIEKLKTKLETDTMSYSNARRIKERIETLEKSKEQGNTSHPIILKTGEEATYFEDVEAQRLGFIFEGKPTDETRNMLKHNGFRWAPSMGRWQRQLTNNAHYAVKNVTLDSPTPPPSSPPVSVSLTHNMSMPHMSMSTNNMSPSM